MSSLWERVRHLELHIESAGCTGLELATDGGWLRRTTVVRFAGAGMEGRGEDVTYDSAEQVAFQAAFDPGLWPGRFSLEEFSARLDGMALGPEGPDHGASRDYRRWAVESAALDLALRQHGQSLAAVLGRTARPVVYGLSLGLGATPSVDPVRERLERFPDARFKLDWSGGWTAELIAELASLNAVDVVDLKGQYHGVFQGPAPDAEGYRLVAEGLPDAWLEDPGWDGSPGPVDDVLAPHVDRLTWDAVLHGVGDLEDRPVPPRCVNIKPSRFGPIRELFAAYEWCEARGVAMYGGGQFELGPGRLQIQQLASLFHPDGPNDVAPAAFHSWPRLEGDVPRSPMPAAVVLGP